MVDISSLATILPYLLNDLPLILGAAQFITYLFLVLFFGSIIIKGYQGYLSFFPRMALRILLGVLCLFTGIGISVFFPQFAAGIWGLLQAHVVIGMLISTIVLTIALFMITNNVFNVASLKRKIEKLQKTLKKAESMKPKKRVNPLTVAGSVIFVVFLVISLLNFHGFPSLQQSFIDAGIPIDEMSNIVPDGVDMSSECISTLSVFATAYQNNPDLFNNPDVYEDETLKVLMEEKTGSTIISMFKVEHESSVIIIGISQDGQQCMATETDVCMCQQGE